VLTDEDPIALPSEPMPLPIISQPIEAPMGIVTHYYAHLGVAVIHLKLGALRVGNRIHFKGSTTDFRQSIDSIEMDHKPVTEGHAGQLIGLKVIETVREHDHVYKVNHK
jgi:translation elongation factor EF-1alpha